MSQRTDRVDELLRQEITAILAKEIADPEIGFATVTDVETAPDLRNARVWVSVIGTEAERSASVRALQRAMGFVRRELGTRLRLKRIPELHVRIDDSAERGTRVLRLLDELEAGRPVEDIEVDESLPTPVARIGRDGDVDDVDRAEPERDAAARRRRPRPVIPRPRGGQRAGGRAARARRGPR